MSGDSKIGLQVGGVVRAGAMRKLAGDCAAPLRAAAPVPPAGDPEPVARLIGLTHAIADQGPPVDTARVASLRSAIAAGTYRIDPGATARAMLDFHQGSPAC